MDEQRLAAYLQLIQALLECPSGEEEDILNANLELVDVNFVQVMEVVAANMAVEGNSNAAAWLQNLAANLANHVSSTATPEEYLSFLGEVLQATMESDVNPQVVYPILQENLDKLDLNFAQILAISKFTEVSSEEAAAIAGVIVYFGNLINQFPQGRRAWNLEIGIACYSAASEVYTREDYPEQWATAQNNLGNAYSDRIEGARAENIEDAIACYWKASEVYTCEDYPEQWAMTQNNLGNAYSGKIEGVRPANIEEAIACFRLALEIRTPTAFPLDCLQSGRNLGNTAFTAGFWDIALEGFEKAIQAVEKSRSWATSDEIRQQILAESIGVYEKAIQACVNSNQLEKAIEYCDRTRAQRLVDLMHSNDLYASGEIPPAVQKYLQEFEAKQREIDAEVEQLRKPSEGNKELAGVASQSRSRAELSAYTEKIQELEAQKQRIWENIRRLDPVLAGQVQVDPMQFAAMQKLIDNSQTAIL